MFRIDRSPSSAAASPLSGLARGLALAAVLVVPLLAAGPAAGAERRDLAPVEQAIEAEEPERALALLAPILARRDDDAEALLLRSTARFMTGDLDAGRRDLSRSLELDPTLRQAWLNRAGLDIAEGRYDDALAALAEAERLDPEAADNALNIGAVQLLQGDLAAATASFERHIEHAEGFDDTEALGQAHYLVATNYAASGYARLAVESLRRAVAADERSRLRARLDPNFEELGGHPAFQELLATDSFEVPAGHHRARQAFEATYAGGEGPLLPALLDGLRAAGERFDPRVETAPGWALVWGDDLRLKVSDGTVWVTAPPEAVDVDAFRRRTSRLFQALEASLAARTPKSPPPGS